MSLTPLSLSVGATDTPREPVPPALVLSGTVDPDGVFTIDVPKVGLSGVTNLGRAPMPEDLPLPSEIV